MTRRVISEATHCALTTKEEEKELAQFEDRLRRRFRQTSSREYTNPSPQFAEKLGEVCRTHHYRLKMERRPTRHSNQREVTIFTAVHEA